MRAVKWCPTGAGVLGREPKRASIPSLLLVLGLLVAACGGGDDTVDQDDLGFVPEAADAEAPVDMDQLREDIQQQVEEFELPEVEQRPDRPLQQPADVAVSGDLVGTFTGNPSCTYRDNSLTVRFGQSGQEFDWTTDLSGLPRVPRVTLAIPDFTGGGAYEAHLYVTSVEDVAEGTADVMVEELWRDDLGLPEERLGLEGTFQGAFSGEVGSAEISGRLGVCNVPFP